MSDTLQQELEKLKIIYYEIIAGSSFVPELNVFVKHFTELDNLQISKAKQSFLQKYKEDGIPFYQERYNTLVKNNEWSIDDDKKIDFLKTLIIDNEKNISKVIKEQRPIIENILKSKRSELAEALFKKREIFGATSEEFADRDTLQFVAFKGIYLDSECSKPKFKTFDDFLTLSDEDSDKYVSVMDDSLAKFTENNIKIIAAMPFFINVFSYVKEDVSKFFKKSMVDLSHFQFLLLSLGSRNTSVLSQIDGDPPELIQPDDVQKLVDFYDKEYSVLLGKRKSSK